MFFDVNWTVGKILDYATDSAGIVNTNNMPGAQKLHVIHVGTGAPIPFATALGKANLQNGDAIIIERLPNE
jgi:hypothetical protein